MLKPAPPWAQVQSQVLSGRTFDLGGHHLSLYVYRHLPQIKETPMVVLFNLCADDDYELDDVIDGDVDDDEDEDPQLEEAPGGGSVQLLCCKCFPI